MSKIFEMALGRDLSERLHQFVKKVQSDSARRARRENVTSERLDDLEADLGFLAMLQVATLRLLDDKGILKDDELVPRLMLADRMDGVEDGSLSIAAVRDAIGLPRKKARAPGTGAASSSPAAAGNAKKPPLKRFNPNRAGKPKASAKAKAGGRRARRRG